MNLRTRSIIMASGLLVLGLPLAYVLTLLLFPLWRLIEETTGLEAVVHSGPAGWCFVAVYALMLLACVAGVIVAVKKSSPGNEQSPGLSAPRDP